MDSKAITAGLGAAGKALVASILADLKSAGLEPDAREAAALQSAGVLRDREVELEACIAADGLTITSGTGFLRVHPAVAERRQTSVALARILSAVALADTTSEGGKVKSARHQRAAAVRWAKEADHG